jgi:hypothetical protein
MKDVPTNTNSNTANYNVLNATIRMYNSFDTITNGNLKLTVGNTNGVTDGAIGTQLLTSGKWYFEATVAQAPVSSGSMWVGVSNNPVVAGLGVYNGNFYNNGYSYKSTGTKNENTSVGVAYGSSYTTGDVIGVALDIDNATITFYKNNVSQGIAFSSITSTGGFVTGVATDAGSSNNASWTVNFGQQPFVYTAPTGFLPLNTYNLSTPTILAGSQYMDATTYTGDGTTSKTVTGLNFQPDWVWTKARSQSYRHAVFDVVRGFGNVLQPSFTDAEFTDGTTAGTSFFQGVTSNGFIVGLPTSGTYSGNAGTNENGTTYVGWSWRTSNTSGVSNTAGSITSTVSANTTSGFSILTYTGNGTAGATIGHGLGVAPSMMIFKTRNGSGAWLVWHIGYNSNQAQMLLNTSAAIFNPGNGLYFNSTYPSSTVATLGTSGSTNGSGTTYVAYMFAPVAGYSAFGSYVGNGNSDGAFVYLGFRPRYIMTKSTGVEDWAIIDTSRSTYNLQGADLYADLSIAEGTSGYDILSNGIKFRSTGGSWNASGTTYIYMAFAENPFKIARGR